MGRRGLNVLSANVEAGWRHRAGMTADQASAEAGTKKNESTGRGPQANELGHEFIRSLAV